MIAIAAGGRTFGLDTTRSLDQFTTTKWTQADGAPAGISAITQALDGYLWLGTSAGLYRFDGVSFERIPPSSPASEKSDHITALLAAKSGEVWVGHEWGGVSVYRNGKLVDAGLQLHQSISKIVEDGAGGIWVETPGPTGQLRRFSQGRWESVGADWGVPKGAFFHSMYAARDGSVWVSLLNTVLRLPLGSRRFDVVDDTTPLALMIEQPNGGVWLLSASGIHQPHLAMGRPPARQPLEQDYSDAKIDRDGGLWATGLKFLGLVRYRAPFSLHPIAERFGNSDSLSPGSPDLVAEDREGDIWVTTSLGLSRIRPQHIFALPLFQYKNLNYKYESRVYSTSDGVIYAIGSGYDGLYRISRDSISEVIPSRPFSSYIGNRGFCADQAGGFWTALPDGPIEHFTGGRVISIGRPAGAAGPGHLLFSCFGDRRSFWGSIVPFGVFRFDGSTWAPANLNNYWKTRTAYPVSTDSQGRGLVYINRESLWRVDGNKVETLWDKKNIDIGLIDSIYHDGNIIYIGGETGLTQFDGHRFRTLSARDYDFLRQVNGIVRSATGRTWLFTSAGIVEISTPELDHAFEHPQSSIDVRIYDASDGLPGGIVQYSYNQLVEAHDGTVWVGTYNGVAWFDPNHIYRNLLPPPVSIRALTANGVRYKPDSTVRLPPNISDLQIDYTALSLQAPNRVRFRYKLEGFDKQWVDPGTRRQAFYTNLSPGPYKFQVIAANNDGVWNNTGAFVKFSIQPTLFQSKFFVVFCGIAAAGLLWGFYTLRMLQVSTRLRLLMAERIAERVRIARELHDTFLQSTQSMILRFQAVADGIPPDQPAATQIQQELGRADLVLIEGRNRVRDLRMYEASENLAGALESAAQRMLSDTVIKSRVIVEGRRRNVKEEICDEVARIADEFLFNTRQHAQANNVLIEIVFSRRRLLVRMADDGIGIDAVVLERGGRPGHFGLIGMRERAERIQADFTLTNSRSATGTELTLVLPAGVAYVPFNGLFGTWSSGGASVFQAKMQ